MTDFLGLLVKVIVGVDTCISSRLKLTPAICLMGWWLCDAEMLKLNCLVRSVGMLIDQGHSHGLVQGKTCWQVGYQGCGGRCEGGLRWIVSID